VDGVFITTIDPIPTAKFDAADPAPPAAEANDVVLLPFVLVTTIVLLAVAVPFDFDDAADVLRGPIPPPLDTAPVAEPDLFNPTPTPTPAAAAPPLEDCNDASLDDTFLNSENSFRTPTEAAAEVERLRDPVPNTEDIPMVVGFIALYFFELLLLTLTPTITFGFETEDLIGKSMEAALTEY
jgi:hypothetical protein